MSSDPYRPPSANLEKAKEPAGPPPRAVKISIGLFVVSIVLSLFTAFALQIGLLGKPLPAAPSPVLTAINTFVSLALWGALVYKTYTGANWARWILAVFCGLGAIGLGVTSFIPDVWNLLPPVMHVSAVVQTLLQVAATVLLFLGPSSRWFRAQ